MRITADGVQVFPRIIKKVEEADCPRPTVRLSTGVTRLDEMLGGGIPAWDSVLVAGPAGSGKSALATRFIAEGLKQGETGVIAVFEERPREYVARAKTLGPDLKAAVGDGLLEVFYMRLLDLSVDEALLEIQAAVRRLNAKRLVIDSLSGFELALAPTFRQDFRESLYHMIGALTGAGVTVFMTVEVAVSFNDLQFSPDLISFLTDDIIIRRYVEMDGELRKVIAVVKMRGSPHDRSLRAYEISEHGLQVGAALLDYTGIVTGVARPWYESRNQGRLRLRGHSGVGTPERARVRRPATSRPENEGRTGSDVIMVRSARGTVEGRPLVGPRNKSVCDSRCSVVPPSPILAFIPAKSLLE